MKRAKEKETVELTVKGVEAFFEKTATRFGSGAKIDCPKQYLGRNVFVVVRRPTKRRKESREGAAEDQRAAG